MFVKDRVNSKLQCIRHFTRQDLFYISKYLRIIIICSTRPKSLVVQPDNIQKQSA